MKFLILLRNSIITIFLSVSCSTVFCADIKGYVYDKYTGEQLIGATITITPGSKKSVTSIDGSFSFKNINEGIYSLRISFVDYKSLDTSISVKNDVKGNFTFYLLPESTSLSNITISKSVNGASDEFANKKEQYANSIVNIISAHTIAISPDITVANVMQRISGVSIERGNTGDGQYAIIRGMDKRYNTTLINDVKIPSPDNRNRYVPLDIFPAELLDRIEVIKSLTPDMEGDATGGVVDLIMKNAPDKLSIEGNAATGYSQLFLNRDFDSYSKSGINLKSPAEMSGPNIYAPISAFPYNNMVTKSARPPLNKNFSLTIGDRFLHDKLGIIVSGSYQNAYRGSNSNVLLQSPTVPPASDSSQAQQPAFSDIYVRHFSTRVDRSGIESKIDYNFNKNNSISLFATYLQLNERTTRVTSDSLLGGYSTADNYVGSFAIYDKTETRSDLQSIYNATLQGRNQLSDKFTVDWSLVASEAKREVPDIAQFSIGRSVNPNTNTGTFTISSPYVENESREWMHNTDKDLAGYLNFHYKTVIGGNTALIGLGGMYRHKERDNYDNSYSLTPVSDSNSNYEAYTSVPASKFTFIPFNGALGNAAGNPGIYHFNEDVGSGYVQMKYNIKKTWEFLGGVRIEHTHQNYVSSLPVSIAGKSADIKYFDYLPGLQGKYSFDNKQALRFSYFTSIYRPAFADLIPYGERNSSGDVYITTGNPYLNHTTIQNIDFRYELFPKGLDQLMIGAFYKFIKNPIEYGFSLDNYGQIVLKPQNFGNANNYGVEVVFRKYFGDFGVSGNYTFTNSVINAKNYFYFIQSSGGQKYDTLLNRRPLQGQSANVANFSLLYKSTKNKVEAQLALVYTGARINTVSLYKGLDNWEKPTTNLDFSAQKEFGKHYIIYVKANNLLNTPYQVIIKQHNNAYDGKFRLSFQESPNYVTVQYDKFYASYSIGFRFKF